MLQRRFEINKNVKWIKEVDLLAQSYNRRIHSTTKVAPNDVLKNPLIFAFPNNCSSQHNAAANQTSLRAEIRRTNALNKRIPKIGQLVVFSRLRQFGSKEASGTFLNEPLRVVRIDRRNHIPMVYLEDLKGERIKGGAYIDEIFPISGPTPPKIIEKVLKRRKSGRKMEFFVSYRDYPAKFNEWVTKLPNK